MILNGLPGAFSADSQTFATVDPTAFLQLESHFSDLVGAVSGSLQRHDAIGGGAVSLGVRLPLN